jgi:hypothetical protein
VGSTKAQMAVCGSQLFFILKGETMSKKASASLLGIVEKIAKSPFANVPDKAQIKVVGGDHLDREIRIDNTLIGKDGKEVSLKRGAEVEVTVKVEIP